MATPESTYSEAKFTDLWSFKGRFKVLHLTWIAFLICFAVWFNMAPLATTMMADLGLTKMEMGILAIANVAFTIPTRIIVGQLLDRHGPRLIFSGLMVTMSIPTFVFAFSSDFTVLFVSRLALSTVGASFVIGIRMVSEWFPPKEIGRAEGLYAGWGNFGSAASAMVLPVVALNLIGGAWGWRWAIALTGVICLVYGVIYFFSVTDTPPGKVYHRPARVSAMEVSSWGALVGLVLSKIPLVGALAVLAWRLNKSQFINDTAYYAVLGVLGLVYLQQAWKAWQVNAPRLRAGVPAHDRYYFRQVVCLNSTYVANFGAELAVVSMLPAWFQTTFTITPQSAGLIASSFAFTNLFARPLGGFLSDKLGSRRAVMLVTMLGIAIGFALLAPMGAGTPLVLAVGAVLFAGSFIQAAEGATFAIVPLVKKRITGQVAGMAGAYGNVGAVLFLTLLTVVSHNTFFLSIALAATATLVICFLFLKEPSGSFDEEYSEHREPAAAAPP